jgi:hypothetical protein
MPHLFKDLREFDVRIKGIYGNLHMSQFNYSYSLQKSDN